MDTRDTRSCVEINDEIPSPSWTRSGVRKNAQSREESLNKKKRKRKKEKRKRLFFRFEHKGVAKVFFINFEESTKRVSQG